MGEWLWGPGVGWWVDTPGWDVPAAWGDCSAGAVMVTVPLLWQVGPAEWQRLALTRRLLPVLLPLCLGRLQSWGDPRVPAAPRHPACSHLLVGPLGLR